MQTSVALHTLGCKLNFSETSTLGRQLEKEGFIKKDFDDIADVYVINTCSVTENADKECRQIVRRIQRKAPDAMVVITGCYAQLKPKEIADISGVDLVLGAAEKFNLAHHLKEITKGDKTKICSCEIDDVNSFTSSYSIHERTRAFLKVQDGCDYTCSYCTIPMARGKSRSDNIEHVIQQVRQIAEAGMKEVVLTGVNLGDFNYTDSENNVHDFFKLIQQLENAEGIERFRISSIEPNLLTDEIIEFVSNSKKFMPHFHIPLQSGNNKILGLMRRRYQRELYAQKIERIKKQMPHCCIGVDVIIGFPSETEADFKETFDFIHSLDISYLHVFTYSERPDTTALEIKPVVPIPVRHERNKILRNLSYQKMQYFIQQHSGTIRNVLFEANNKNETMEGYTDNYIKVTTSYNAALINRVTDWKI